MIGLQEVSHRHDDQVRAAGSHPVPKGEPILELRGLQKNYGAVEALKPANMTFLSGEVHAIVGENGAGKSTLIKLLTGVIARSAGEVRWCGETVELATPNEAIARGINAVHQEVVLCPHLSVAANMFLGDEMSRRGVMRKRAMTDAAQGVLDDLGFNLPANAELGSLTIGQQQLVATARAAMRGTQFLIFDEPTAYLTRQESAQLFRLIRRLQSEGVTIVYISHRLEEVFELADRVSVLRDGTHVGTRAISETNETELIALMINRSIEQIYHKEHFERGETIVETRGLSGPGFREISLSVRAGEIVGLYGLIGAGRSEFALGLYGRNPVSGGEIFWQGRKTAIANERDAMELGIALAPESRRDQGLCLNLPIGLNINLPVFKRLTRGLTINRAEEASNADRQIRDLNIKTPSRRVLASAMSGGNQQKIVIGRWLSHGAKLFIFDEPTVGVDVGTKAEIYRLFARLLENGAGIILISSYLPEVYELADRLHVFRQGRLVASHDYRGASHEEVLAQAINA
ncbi:ATP-binding cassette domain-containing protein [Sinorhizobium medicae]|uniref:ABC transporter ATP-binding protein n=2 Tax=Sinorhizobium medicae TaxID=110321 RepID=A0A6G1WPW4_9HYPH|nr:sugar ABC transporter ATP-binding protein [Sinorhizobium medicae]ABR62052.1 ABC transporter related [Sinorhizobium medicae WSM419]MBO1941069.1 sugar ABC transporter ATP-binding protein [Sinorhizobium medicae]MBO1964315.1 sugar ABC transporter ATP-binding protein [Sinorhizobium medicae]MDX0404335.1 ATP-binding cassette domain-containing protein [Sinorhizobium medicae]MDX0410272.1 ATP-binding cassette domain-containing protein [Sinorhizobium medicae]